MCGQRSHHWKSSSRLATPSRPGWREQAGAGAGPDSDDSDGLRCGSTGASQCSAGPGAEAPRPSESGDAEAKKLGYARAGGDGIRIGPEAVPKSAMEMHGIVPAVPRRRCQDPDTSDMTSRKRSSRQAAAKVGKRRQRLS
jgi:hypothetical protein